MKKLKDFSWSLFLLVLICSFMPFSTVSCGDEKIAAFSGAELARGITLDMAGEPMKINPDPAVLTVLACALAAMIILLAGKTREMFFLAMILSVIGAGALITYHLTVSKRVLEAGSGLIMVSYGPGYWISLFALTAGAVITGLLFADETKKIKKP